MKDSTNNGLKEQLIELMAENEELKEKVADYEALLDKKDAQIEMLEQELTEAIEMTVIASTQPSNERELLEELQQRYAHLQLQFNELKQQEMILVERNQQLQKQNSKITELRSMIENLGLEKNKNFIGDDNQ
jgi:chromosome segregation ATPase